VTAVPDVVRPAVTVGADTLKYLNLDPTSPIVHALVLLCNRYGLDPILGHALIFKDHPYITRDGMLEIAHRSGQLDGIVVEEQRESDNGYSATVSVYRKDMGWPFTYKGGCGAEEPNAKQGHGPEMALARAERRALRRAFNIPVYGDTGDEPLPEEIPPATTPPSRPAAGQIRAARSRPAPPKPPRRRTDQPPPEYYDNLPEARPQRQPLAIPPGETPAPVAAAMPGRGGTTQHEIADDDGTIFTCTCGAQFNSGGAYHRHRVEARHYDQPPDEVYDTSPESTGAVDADQEPSYEDPGRPFDVS
jgi:hypothetical protein